MRKLKLYHRGILFREQLSKLFILCLLALFLGTISAAHAQQGEISNEEAAADCAVSSDLVVTIAESMGWDAEKIEFLPWMRPLSAAQAMTAEVEKNRLVFPKEGNPWLSCVQKNHLLWSVLPEDFDHLFARRVLKVMEEPDRVIFQTREAGMGEVTAGVWGRNEDPLLTELKEHLPTELRGGMMLAFFDTDTDGDGTVVAYTAVYRGPNNMGVMLPVIPLNTEGMKEYRNEYEKEAENDNMQQEAHSGRTAYVMRDEMMNILSVLLDGAVVQLMSGKLDIEELYTVLDTLDLDALEAFAAKANES